MNDEIKTPEEIQALKDSWVKDPCWDIEKEEGFEAHKEELLSFRKEQEAKWDAELAIKQAKRFADVQRETGISDFELAQTISTFSELESQVKRQDQQTGYFSSSFETSSIEIQQAQVRATLLLAAQIKRVADLLESMDGRDSFAETVAIWKPS